MPIIGSVNATPSEYRIENMKVGDEGYAYVEDMILTRKALFIDISSRVLRKDSLYNDIFENTYDLIPIKRIGKGLTELDYDLDFSNPDNYYIMISSHKVHLDLIASHEKYIIFYKFQILETEGDAVELMGTTEDRLEILNMRLSEALDVEDYPKAIELRDEINKLTKVKKN